MNNNILIEEQRIKLLKLVEQDGNNLNFVSKDLINDELIEIAINNNFKFKFIGQREIKKNLATHNSFSNFDELQINNNSFLLNYPNLVLSSFFNGYKTILFEEKIDVSNNNLYDVIIEKIINSNIDINYFRNIDLLKNNKIKNYIYNKYFNHPKTKALFEKCTNTFPNEELLLNFKTITCVINKSFIEIFGENTIYLILKYIIMTNNKFYIERFNENEYDSLKKLFYTLNYNNQNMLLVLKFQEFVNFFAHNKLLFTSIISNINTLCENDIINLNLIINSNLEDIKINNITELKNFNTTYYNHINNTKNITAKDKISLYISGERYLKFKKYLYTKLNSKKIKEIEKKYNIDVPLKYKIFIEYVEYIFSLKDEYILNNIFNDLNYNEITKISINELNEIANKIFYEIYSLKFTQLDQIKNKRIENDITIYELNGENFSFLGHTINAFEYDHFPSYEMKALYNETVGQNYICTSYIDENHTQLFKNKNNILFNTLSSEQLLSLSNVDMHTEKNQSNINILSTNINYLLPLEMSCKTKLHNEFVIFRQNNKCIPILPCALLCYSNEEIPYELAKQYNLPIVIINQKIYEQKRNLKFETFKNEVLTGNLNHIEEVIALSFKCKKMFDNNELKIIRNYITNIDDLNNFFEILLKYNYDNKIINNLINSNKII